MDRHIDAMIRLLITLLTMLGIASMYAPQTHAIGLKVAPLEYRTVLKAGEKQKGFVDISNPSKETLVVKTSVQAFRQIDDAGTLEFFDDEQLSAGVKLDLDEFNLGPREAVRMYFLADGAKLPAGDIYGAIFFSTSIQSSTPGVRQAVRLGSLLSITNGTPGPRQGAVTKLSVPTFQFDDVIKGSYSFTNTSEKGSATGYYPTVFLSVQPFGEKKSHKGKLVFAGNTRSNEFSLKALPLGIYRVSASYQAGEPVHKWIVVASPSALLWLIVAAFVAYVFSRLRKHRRAVKFRRR